MEKTIFEQMGSTYTEVGDYLLPGLKLSEKGEQANIGVWGMRHKRYLNQNHKVRYYNLLTSGRLNSYLADIDKQVEKMFSRLVKQLAEKECVTEKLKSNDIMLWVRKMNSIRNRTTEIVNSELIFTVWRHILYCAVLRVSNIYCVYCRKPYYGRGNILFLLYTRTNRAV